MYDNYGANDDVEFWFFDNNSAKGKLIRHTEDLLSGLNINRERLDHELRKFTETAKKSGILSPEQYITTIRQSIQAHDRRDDKGRPTESSQRNSGDNAIGDIESQKSFVMTKNSKKFYKKALESLIAIRAKVKRISQAQALRDMEKEVDEILNRENCQQKKMEDELIKQRKKLGNINVGIDPETIQAGITLAGYHFEAGTRKFTVFAQAMINDMGDAIKPYLKSFYNAVRDWPGFNAEGMDDYDTVSGTDIDELMVSEPTEEELRAMFPEGKSSDLQGAESRNDADID